MRRRVLLVNLDFRDVVYSHLWGQAVLDACARRSFLADVVAVNPLVGRDVAAELGVPRSAVELRTDGTVVYLDKPDDTTALTVIRGLLEQNRYLTLFLNCDAPLLRHLIIDYERELAGALWVIYDRHLHLDMPAPDQGGRLRERIRAWDMHLYTLQEIAAGLTHSAEGIIGRFEQLGFSGARIHVQKWPLDDEFFAPQPDAAPTEGLTLFSGGDSGRDYATLFEAIRGMPVQLRLCAGNYPTPVPPNVTVLPRLPLYRFRDEVARAAVVVVPVTGQPVVSGITVIAMAKMLGKPVIAADNRVVRLHIQSQGDGGYLTQTGNPVLLRWLLRLLIESPAERARLASEGRAQAVRDCSLRNFAERMLELQ